MTSTRRCRTTSIWPIPQASIEPVALPLEGLRAALQWSSDGKSLGFLYVPGATRRASAVHAAKPAAGEVGVMPAGNTARRQRRCHRRCAARAHAREHVRLRIRWSPDASRIAYTAASAGRQQLVGRQAVCAAARPNAKPTVLVDPAEPSADQLHGCRSRAALVAGCSRIAFIGG
jgi:hypothetical protein